MSLDATASKKEETSESETKEERSLRLLLEALKRGDDEDGLYRRLVSQRDEISQETLNPGVGYFLNQSEEFAKTKLPELSSIEQILETSRAILGRLRDDVRETIERLHPPPLESSLVIVHVDGKLCPDQMLGALVKVKSDLESAGALLVNPDLKRDGELYKEALILFHRLKDIAEIADQNRVAAAACDSIESETARAA